MEFLANLGPFVLAVIAVIINGVPQLLYAQARGFALKPAGFAYLVGAFGNLLTGSVTPISSQAETITVASVKKNLRNNVSSILLAALLMVILGLFGGVTKIADFAGPAVVAGMMSGVGLILAGVSWDMFGQEKRTTLVSIVSAIIAYAIFLNDGNKVVWTIFISVVVSTADFLFLQKRRVDLSTLVEDGRDAMEMSSEWRFWKKEYWSDFKLIKPTLNLSVVLGALSLMMLNIGANISFGGITASIAGTTPELRSSFHHQLPGGRSQRAVWRPAYRGHHLRHGGRSLAGGLRHRVHAGNGRSGAAGPDWPSGQVSARAEHFRLPAGHRALPSPSLPTLPPLPSPKTP